MGLWTIFVLTLSNPFCLKGYFPLYDTSDAARNASQDDGYHEHTIDGTTYYMPDNWVDGNSIHASACPQDAAILAPPVAPPTLPPPLTQRLSFPIAETEFSFYVENAAIIAILVFPAGNASRRGMVAFDSHRDFFFFEKCVRHRDFRSGFSESNKKNRLGNKKKKTEDLVPPGS